MHLSFLLHWLLISPGFRHPNHNFSIPVSLSYCHYRDHKTVYSLVKNRYHRSDDNVEVQQYYSVMIVSFLLLFSSRLFTVILNVVLLRRCAWRCISFFGLSYPGDSFHTMWPQFSLLLFLHILPGGYSIQLHFCFSDCSVLRQ